LVPGLAWTLEAAHDDRGVGPCGVLERLLPTAGGGAAAAEGGAAAAKAGRVVSEGRCATYEPKQGQGGAVVWAPKGCSSLLLGMQRGKGACSTADINCFCREEFLGAAKEAKGVWGNRGLRTCAI